MLTAQPVSQEALPLLDELDRQFLNAWKMGAELIGPHYFKGPAPTPHQARHWRHLTPDLDAMRRKLINRSQADAVFAAAMASFYNAQEGHKLMKRAGCETFGSAVTSITTAQRGLLAQMVGSYQKW